MTGKEKIIECCNTVETHNIEWLQTCLDVGTSLEGGNDSYLDHCPEPFFDDYFDGDCELDDHSYDREQCKECWERALNLSL